MKYSPQTQPDAQRRLVTLSEVVNTVRGLSRNDVEAATVINHLLLTGRICFAPPASRKASRMLRC